MSNTITAAASVASLDPAAITDIPASVLSNIPPAVLSSLTAALATGGSAPASAPTGLAGIPAGVCIQPPMRASAFDLPGTTVTLQELFEIVGGMCMGLATLLALLNFVSHLLWRSNLRQQKYLMRLTILPAVFSIFSWSVVDEYTLGIIFNPIPKLYVMYCVVTYFNYMLEVVTPGYDYRRRSDFFIAAERRHFWGSKHKHRHGSLRWLRFNTVLIYFALFVNFVVFVLSEVIGQTACHTHEFFANFQLILNTINVVFTVTGVFMLPRTYWRFREEFRGTYVLRRFVCFKPFVLVIALQNFIFGIISYTRSVEPTKYMSASDFQNGIPAFMTCCWSFIFAWGFSHSLTGYHFRKAGSQPDASIGKYLLAFLLPTDVLIGTWRATGYLLHFLNGREYDYTGGTGITFLERQQTRDGLRLDEAVVEKPAPAVEEEVEEKSLELTESSEDNRPGEAREADYHGRDGMRDSSVESYNDAFETISDSDVEREKKRESSSDSDAVASMA